MSEQNDLSEGNLPATFSKALAEAVASSERGEWTTAFRSFSRLDNNSELAGDHLERLGVAAYMAGHEPDFIKAFERAFQAYIGEQQTLRAARCAFWIGLTLMFRNEFGQGSGWFQKLDRLVEEHDGDCVEKGYLLLPSVEMCLKKGDMEAAYQHATNAWIIGRCFGDKNLQSISKHLQGRVRMEIGDVERGVILLDEAMVGVTTDRLSPIVTGLVYCSVIEICQKFHVKQRAKEWTTALTKWCAEQPEIVAFTGRCLIHRAEILIFDGNWAEAAKEANAACRRLEAGPVEHHAGPAFYQAGEVHRLRGRFADADKCYRSAVHYGFDPQPGIALMRLRQGKDQSALSSIRRALAAVEDPVGRLRLLPSAVEITLAAGSVDAARALCAEMREYVDRYSTDALEATADEAVARVQIAEGHADTAIAALRRAGDVWRELQAPYSYARVRTLTGRACADMGDREGARWEIEAALEMFLDLGAIPDLNGAKAILHRLESTGDGLLTRRQVQILQLIAHGMTNPEIAQQLKLSRRTIDRHVSDILTRLDVPTRSAATAYALTHGLIESEPTG